MENDNTKNKSKWAQTGHLIQKCKFKLLIQCDSCKKLKFIFSINETLHWTFIPHLQWVDFSSLCVRKSVMSHKDRSVMKMSHCLKGLIWGTTVLVPHLLTPTIWVVIISLRCPCHLSHEAITVCLNTTWMWPCASVASPLQTLYRCCRMTDRLIHTWTPTPVVSSEFLTTFLWGCLLVTYLLSDGIRLFAVA